MAPMISPRQPSDRIDMRTRVKAMTDKKKKARLSARVDGLNYPRPCSQMEASSASGVRRKHGKYAKCYRTQYTQNTQNATVRKMLLGNSTQNAGTLVASLSKHFDIVARSVGRLTTLSIFVCFLRRHHATQGNAPVFQKEKPCSTADKRNVFRISHCFSSRKCVYVPAMGSRVEDKGGRGAHEKWSGKLCREEWSGAQSRSRMRMPQTFDVRVT